VGQHHRLGQAAGLVELDVDGVVAPAEGIEAGAIVQALVGADRDRPGDLGEERVLASGQRLLDQADAGGDAGVNRERPAVPRRSAPGRPSRRA
jgi:hypothetical protein